MFSSDIRLKFFSFFAVVLYKAALDFSYTIYVSKVFEYAGFLLDFNVYNYILSNLILIVIFFFVPTQFDKISDWFLNFFYLIILVPIGSMYGLNQELSLSVFIMNISVFIIIYLMLRVKQVKVPRLKYISRGEGIFLSSSIMMIFYLIFWYFITGAISNFNLDLSKVYDFREINSELTNIGFAVYVNNWVYQIFSLALLGYGFLRKNYIIIVFSLISQIIFFGVSAHKSVLFSIFMIIGLYYFFRFTKNLIVVPIFFTILIVISLYISFSDMRSIYPSIFIRRLFFVPAQLSYAYYDFFQNNPHDFWAQSIMSVFFETNYPEGVSKTIGNYLGGGASANNGFVSSGYAQAGLFGVILYTLITGWILKNIDYLSNSNGYPLWFSLILVVNPLKNLILASDLFTTLLTHGLLISILLLILFNKNEAIKK